MKTFEAVIVVQVVETSLADAAKAAVEAVNRMTSPSLTQFRRISITDENAFHAFCGEDAELYRSVMLAESIGYPIYAIVADDGSIARMLICDTVYRRNANGFRENVSITELHEAGACDLISENVAKNFIKVNK